MENQTIELQAKIYVYDLNNCAKEYGFKTDEGWELSLATGDEKAQIEKDYCPTIATKVLPEILSELYHLVRSKLIQAKFNIEKKMDTSDTSAEELQYLIAFNPKRLR